MVIIISHSFGKLMYFQSFNDTALPEQFDMCGKVLSQIVKLHKSYLILSCLQTIVNQRPTH